MNNSPVPFPDASVSEWSAIRTNSASGLFAYRNAQAINLLELPDFGDGDLTREQRSDALRNAVNFLKPLSALSIFLGVVALEDFIRDFGARMADDRLIGEYFPRLKDLRSKPIARGADQTFKRLDTDPTGVIDPELVNGIFSKSLGIEPIPREEFSRLRDLALIRHTVAHHAAVVRPVDVPRFQYYTLRPFQTINPPVEFVRETLTYLFNIGRAIEVAVRDRVFKVVMPSLDREWWEVRPAELVHLIEFFDFFGFIEAAIGPIGYVALGTPEYEQMKNDAEKIKERLVVRCIKELRAKFDLSSMPIGGPL